MTDKDILSDPEIDRHIEEWFRLYDERIAALRLKQENPYVRDLIEALLPYPRGQHRSWIIEAIEKKRKAQGIPIPVKFPETVQSVYNQHCTDSSVFRKRRAPETDGLFYAAGSKGSGYWALHPDKAKAWLAAKVRSS